MYKIPLNKQETDKERNIHHYIFEHQLSILKQEDSTSLTNTKETGHIFSFKNTTMFSRINSKIISTESTKGVEKVQKWWAAVDDRMYLPN